MDVLTGAFQILALVIVVGGVAKIASPTGFSSLLRTLGLPSGRLVAQASGVLEVVLGAAALVYGGRVAALLLAGVYAGFTVVVMAARRSGAASCGCFGAVAAPPSTVHVVVNSVSSLIALAAAVGGPSSLTDTLADQPLAAVPYVLAVLTGVWLTVVLDTTGAEVIDGIGRVREQGPAFRAHTATGGAPAATHAHSGDGSGARTAPSRRLPMGSNDGWKQT